MNTKYSNAPAGKSTGPGPVVFVDSDSHALHVALTVGGTAVSSSNPLPITAGSGSAASMVPNAAAYIGLSPSNGSGLHVPADPNRAMLLMSPDDTSARGSFYITSDAAGLVLIAFYQTNGIDGASGEVATLVPFTLRFKGECWIWANSPDFGVNVSALCYS